MKNIQLLLFFLFSYINVNSQWMWFTDTVNFENNFKIQEYIKLDTNNGNIWRIGKPEKLMFNNAYSGEYAIMTDLKGYYPPNTHSSFIMKFFPKEFALDFHGDEIAIEAYYKIDCDSLKDYGIMEMSPDNGLNWNNLLDTVYHHGRWYIDGKENKPIFTGNYNDKWHFFTFVTRTQYAIDADDSLWFRFTFISDSINNNKEGWIIDNIKIYNDPTISIKEFTQKKDLITISPNPVKQSENFSISLKNIDAKLINIYSSQGKLQLQIVNPTKSFTLNTTQFQKGLFLVEIIDVKNARMKKKLVIN
jgi:hypothetical protein